ncbi:MAG: 50S ribosomal protein L1 [Rickettsiales bacterium]|jgi:large subunit ribosomal protein L1|nr:50S ribosomal protein L1 [Rickettsiales bacterium]
MITKKIKGRVKLDAEKLYDLTSAIDTLKGFVSKKFDETFDIAIKLGVDVTKADQNIRGMVSLPHGTGKKIKVAVFTKDKQSEAKKAGADFVGDTDLIDKVAGGFLGFDIAIATPDIMPQLSKIAKILGPKGMMPNPKLGTVASDPAKAIELAKAGQIEYRAEKSGIIHAGFGKASFKTPALVENANALIDALKKAKPATSKGNYILTAAVSTTQGPGLKLDVKALQ